MYDIITFAQWMIWIARNGCIVVVIQLVVHLAAVILTLLLNVPVLLSNVLLRLTTAGDADVPVFSAHLGQLYTTNACTVDSTATSS